MATRNYISTYNALHRDGHLPAQCEMYILIHAVPTIYAESTDTTNHAARLAWAQSMEQDSTALERSKKHLLIKCVQNATIATTIEAGGNAEDSDVEFVGDSYLSVLVSLTS